MLPLGIGIDRARKLYLLVFGLALLEYAFRVGDGMVGWVGILYIYIYIYGQIKRKYKLQKACIYSISI